MGDLGLEMQGNDNVGPPSVMEEELRSVLFLFRCV